MRRNAPSASAPRHSYSLPSVRSWQPPGSSDPGTRSQGLTLMHFTIVVGCHAVEVMCFRCTVTTLSKAKWVPIGVWVVWASRSWSRCATSSADTDLADRHCYFRGSLLARRERLGGTSPVTAGTTGVRPRSHEGTEITENCLTGRLFLGVLGALAVKAFFRCFEKTGTVAWGE